MSDSPEKLPPAEALIGRVLKGAYRLDSKLGEGGMGAVFKATQLAVDRQVAVKVLRTQVKQDPAMAKQMQARFMREAKLTSKLEHPNTVRLIDFGETEEDKMLFLVLELLRGQELSRVMQKQAPLSPQRVARIGRQMCQSLSEAHAQGIIHRDLKPDNVFLCEYHGVKDHVKIVDFGIARIVGGDFEETSQLTATGLIIGTPKYMAPEQVQAQEITAQTDLYALGVIMYEMLLGRAPFHADSVMALAFKHVHDEPEPLPDSFGHGWQSIITQLLAKHPAARPTNADVVASILGTLEQQDLGDIDLSPRAAAALPGPLSQQTMGDDGGFQPKKKSGVVMAMVAGLVVGIGAVAGIILSGGDGKDAAAKPAEIASDNTKKKQTAEPDEETKKAEDAKMAAEAENAKEEAEKAKKEAEAKAAKAAEAEAKVAPAEPAKPAKVTLRLNSGPKGAQVVRPDGSELCVTPCDLQLDPTNAAEIVTLKLKGYQDKQLALKLTPGNLIVEAPILDKITAPPAPTPTVGKGTKPKPRARGGKPKPRPKPKPTAKKGDDKPKPKPTRKLGITITRDPSK